MKVDALTALVASYRLLNDYAADRSISNNKNMNHVSV